MKMAAKFKKNILMWLLWLIMIIIWNYVWPQANPLQDVLVSVILGAGLVVLKKFLKI